MRVNTDGVLLAAWTKLPPFEYVRDNVPSDTIESIGSTCSDKIHKRLNVLDVGTGTGVIALILAQRLSPSDRDFKITGIDIDHLSIEDALCNFNTSPWRNSLSGEVISLQEYLLRDIVDRRKKQGSPDNSLEDERGEYSLIISNPPYFSNSLKAPAQRRSSARHNDSLPLETLIDAASKLLCYNGTLSLILPVKEGGNVIGLTDGYPLYLNRLCKVRTTPAKPEKRYMMEFIKREGQATIPKIIGDNYPKQSEEELIIQNSDGTYTNQYCNLISDYYYKDLRKQKA
jgi:Predicted O-methyltransferase